MQRTIWDWLGIERTTDKSRIKKAYAEQVKKYHPEEFPEEAQELRKAYKTAMAQASEPRTALGWGGWGENAIGQGNADADPAEEVWQPESGYRFEGDKLSLDRAKRIDDLRKRLEVIYNSPYRNYTKDWRQAFAVCLYPEDLKDLQAVREIFRVIAPMQRLKGPTWEVIQEELFRYQENTASWRQLQERFNEVRRIYTAPEKPVADISSQPSVPQPETDTEEKPRYSYRSPQAPDQQPPETDTEEKPRYSYRSPQAPNQQPPETDTEEKPGYSYRSPQAPNQQLPETDTEEKPRYSYRSPQAPDQQPPETDTEEKPRYSYRSPQAPNQQLPETDTEEKPRYSYRSPQAPAQQPPGGGSGPEAEYQFASPRLPFDREKRIDDLRKRMEAIYGSQKYRNFAKDWRQAFEICLEPEDLRDLQAVWEIFRVIEPMQRLKGSTWEVIQEELFRFREDTAPWQLLQERFNEVRRPYVAPAKKSDGTSEEPAGGIFRGEPEETPAAAPPKKTSWKEFAVVFLGIILLGSLVSFLNKAQTSHNQQKMLEELKMLNLRGQAVQQMIEDTPPVPVSRETFQKTYTEDTPWELDLNGDGLPDHIYYDSDGGLFMVELYDATAETYDSYGSLAQYLEENPETENMKVLSWLAKEGNAK